MLDYLERRRRVTHTAHPSSRHLPSAGQLSGHFSAVNPRQDTYGSPSVAYTPNGHHAAAYQPATPSNQPTTPSNQPSDHPLTPTQFPPTHTTGRRGSFGVPNSPHVLPASSSSRHPPALTHHSPGHNFPYPQLGQCTCIHLCTQLHASLFSLQPWVATLSVIHPPLLPSLRPQRAESLQ